MGGRAVGPRGGLRGELSGFVGRRAELGRVRAALGGARLVTLTGPGGIGKTRLAVATAAEVRRRFRDGAWMVELAGLGDSALLPPEVARAFGLLDQSSGWAVAMLADSLAGRDALLVLDNCEHLLDANTDAINRASRYSYGEATGITQTVRNYGASLGFAILGTLLITRFRAAVTTSLTGKGLPHAAATAQASKFAGPQGGTGNPAAIPAFIRADFATATRDVLYGMAIIMVIAALVALRGLRRGVQQDTAPSAEQVGSQLPGVDPDTHLDTAGR